MESKIKPEDFIEMARKELINLDGNDDAIHLLNPNLLARFVAGLRHEKRIFNLEKRMEEAKDSFPNHYSMKMADSKTN